MPFSLPVLSQVGRNKTTQAWWRFRQYRAEVCRKRLFSLALEKTYSCLQDCMDVDIQSPWMIFDVGRAARAKRKLRLSVDLIPSEVGARGTLYSAGYPAYIDPD